SVTKGVDTDLETGHRGRRNSVDVHPVRDREDRQLADALAAHVGSVPAWRVGALTGTLFVPNLEELVVYFVIRHPPTIVGDDNELPVDLPFDGHRRRIGIPGICHQLREDRRRIAVEVDSQRFEHGHVDGHLEPVTRSFLHTLTPVSASRVTRNTDAPPPRSS